MTIQLGWIRGFIGRISFEHWAWSREAESRIVIDINRVWPNNEYNVTKADPGEKMCNGFQTLLPLLLPVLFFLLLFAFYAFIQLPFLSHLTLTTVMRD